MEAKLLNSDVLVAESHQSDNRPTDILVGGRGIVSKRVLGSSKSKLFGAILRATYRWARLYGFLPEFHTFLCRSYVALESGMGGDGPLAGPAFELGSSQGLVPCKRTQQRMRDMQQVIENKKFPWQPTPLDLVLFLRGWDAGEKWARECGNRDKDR